MDLLSMDNLFNILVQYWTSIVLITTILFLYSYYTKNFDHFKKLGIPYKEPVFMIGNLGSRIMLKTSIHDWDVSLYNEYEGEPYAGFFEGRTPQLMIRDPELIKTVMVKDFDHFVDRGRLNSNPTDYMKRNLLHLQGKEWKTLRGVLTPTFTSGKLRGMQNLIQQCGRQMIEYLHNRPAGDIEVEMKEFTGRYTLEVIGSCAFGLDCSSLKDADAEFVKVAAKFNQPTKLNRALFSAVMLLCPSLMPYLPLEHNNRDSMKQLHSVLLTTISEREKDETKRRNDFLQLVLNAAKKEIVENPDSRILDDLTIQGQAMLFLLAGFETSSTLLSFACLELAANPDIQNHLREEIRKNVEKHGKDCTYDSVKEIAYMEQVLLETLRLHPPIPRVDRRCTKPYTLPGTKINIKPGELIMIPVCGILQDAKYYPQPKEFKPDRFSAFDKNVRSNELFLPFGMGPRNCIGLRFAMMTAKFYLFYMLQEFKLSPCAKTTDITKYDKSSVFLKASEGAWVEIESLKKTS